MEVGFVELNEWAEKVADKTNPEESWDTLVDLEARVTKVEAPDSCRDHTMGSDESKVEVLDAKIRALEGIVSETQEDMKSKGKGSEKSARKPISEAQGSRVSPGSGVARFYRNISGSPDTCACG